MRDRPELETIAGGLRRIRGQCAEPLVLPPHVIRASGVVRDADAPLALVALETAVAEQRSEDDLDLHRVGDHAAKDAFGMFGHASGTAAACAARSARLSRHHE